MQVTAGARAVVDAVGGQVADAVDGKVARALAGVLAPQAAATRAMVRSALGVARGWPGCRDVISSSGKRIAFFMDVSLIGWLLSVVQGWKRPAGRLF